jgi:glutamyl endopeptidase
MRMPFNELWSAWQLRRKRHSPNRASYRPSLQCLEDRTLCTLLPITATSHFPYSAIVHVNAWFGTPHHGGIVSVVAGLEASAVMIGPDTAITSAHVVYNRSLGGLARQVTVTPGQDGHTAPFGSVRVVSWVIPSLYTSLKTTIGLNSGADIAVLQLAPLYRSGQNVPVGEITGWLGHAAYSNQTLENLRVTNVGYPAETLSGINQYRSRGPILFAQDFDGVGVLTFNNHALTIQDGSSGSPLIRATLHGPIVVGLVEASLVDSPINLATRITNRVNDFIVRGEKFAAEGGHVIHFNFAARSHTASYVPASDA